MASFDSSSAPDRGHIIDRIGVALLLGVWAAALVYADFSGVAEIVFALARHVG